MRYVMLLKVSLEKMRDFYIAVFIIIASPSFAFDYQCKPIVSDCSNRSDADTVFWCGDKTFGKKYTYPLHTLYGKTCSEQRLCVEVEAMFDNCFLDKIKGRNEIEESAVRRVCERIACNPTPFQKFKYR